MKNILKAWSPRRFPSMLRTYKLQVLLDKNAARFMRTFVEKLFYFEIDSSTKVLDMKRESIETVLIKL